MGVANLANYEELAIHIPAKELSTLLKVSSSLSSTMELAEVLQIAIESVTDLIGIETGAIYTLENEKLYLGATTPPLPPEFPYPLRFAHLADHPHICQTIANRAPVYLQNTGQAVLTQAEQAAVSARQLISVLYFPLLLKEEAIGVFIIGATQAERQFSKNEIDLCYILSAQVSLALANARLYQKAQQAIVDVNQAYDATLEGWSKVLDMRDHVTDEHTQRVVDLTLRLARRIGIPEAEMGHIRRGALLHDIGKMAIPDAILQKPGALSEAEIPIMQTHPEKAYQIISQISYLVPAIDIPYCHHEKWDGSGYPRGLKEAEIPLTARIFAVIDVYDALTSDRPYRQAWSKEKALDHIQRQAGQHFDPQVVRVFMEMLAE